MLACDKAFKVPPVDDSEYISALLNIALRENISIIMSLFDIDLPYLAQSKDMFAEHGQQ